MQRGERIIRRDRKSRENAEGHAYAEPYYYHSLRSRICVRFSGRIFDNHGCSLRRDGIGMPALEACRLPSQIARTVPPRRNE